MGIKGVGFFRTFRDHGTVFCDDERPLWFVMERYDRLLDTDDPSMSVTKISDTSSFSFTHLFWRHGKAIQTGDRQEASIQRQIQIPILPTDGTMDCDEFGPVRKCPFDLDFMDHSFHTRLDLVTTWDKNGIT